MTETIAPQPKITWTSETRWVSVVHYAVVGAYDLSIIERPSIGYIRWFANGAIVADQSATSVEDAKAKATAWAMAQ